jgi:acetyl-CoA acetyltransferase
VRGVAVVGAGMTRFGKHLDRSLKDLTREAVQGALESAGIDKSVPQVAVVGNAAAGLSTGQECIRAQVVLRDMGIEEIPMINTENACASSSTAFHLAWLYVASGMYDIALAVGMEKMYQRDKARMFAAFSAGVDVERTREIIAFLQADLAKRRKEGGSAGDGGAGKSRSMFMDIYAAGARAHMRKYGTTKEQFAKVAVKNHFFGSLNPHAQYRERYTVEEILDSPLVAEPLTRLMCAPTGDGASAAILVSAEKARRYTTKPVRVRGSALGSGKDIKPGMPGITARVATKAFEMAAVGPEDIDVMEVHDATAPAEIFIYEELGLCPPGEGGRLIDEGATELGGRVPVNTSGGLLAKGHPVGATGVAQIYEVFLQLRGEAGNRQVQGAKAGLCENGGGMVRGEAAATSVHILSL